MEAPTVQFFLPSPVSSSKNTYEILCTYFYKIHVIQILEPYVKCWFTLRSLHQHYVGIICVVICFILLQISLYVQG